METFYIIAICLAIVALFQIGDKLSALLSESPKPQSSFFEIYDSKTGERVTYNRSEITRVFIDDFAEHYSIIVETKSSARKCFNKHFPKSNYTGATLFYHRLTNALHNENYFKA